MEWYAFGRKTTELWAILMTSSKEHMLSVWLTTVNANSAHLDWDNVCQVLAVKEDFCFFFFHLLPPWGWRSTYINYSEFFGMGDLSILSYLLIYSIIYLYHYEFMDVYFILWAIIQYYIIYFVAQIIPALLIWNSFSWTLDPFDKPLLLWSFCFVLFCFWALSYFHAL